MLDRPGGCWLHADHVGDGEKSFIAALCGVFSDDCSSIRCHNHGLFAAVSWSRAVSDPRSGTHRTTYSVMQVCAATAAWNVAIPGARGTVHQHREELQCRLPGLQQMLALQIAATRFRRPPPTSHSSNRPRSAGHGIRADAAGLQSRQHDRRVCDLDDFALYLT